MKNFEIKLLWFVRLSLVAAIAISVLFPDWPQFDGKGMAFRAPFFLASMGAVPIIFKLRGSPEPYPHLVDALVVAPFLLDTLGNALGFYNNFDVTDDVLHVLNWILLIAGVTLALGRTHTNKLTAWVMGYGLGALLIIWWEVVEYIVQILGTAGLGLTYEDTIGDLLLSSTGGGVGAGIVVLFAWPQKQPSEQL